MPGPVVRLTTYKTYLIIQCANKFHPSLLRFAGQERYYLSDAHETLSVSPRVLEALHYCRVTEEEGGGHLNVYSSRLIDHFDFEWEGGSNRIMSFPKIVIGQGLERLKLASSCFNDPPVSAVGFIEQLLEQRTTWDDSSSQR